MIKAEKLLRYSKIFCIIYFILMSVAHFFGLKYPILFIYYDTPFYSYQDKIISFAVLAYVAMFCSSLKHNDLTPITVLLMFLTFLGLGAINLSGALAEVLNGASTLAYWIQTAVIGLIALWLGVLYHKSKSV